MTVPRAPWTGVRGTLPFWARRDGCLCRRRTVGGLAEDIATGPLPDDRENRQHHGYEKQRRHAAIP
jgi:hypothetical protein